METDAVVVRVGGRADRLVGADHGAYAAADAAVIQVRPLADAYKCPVFTAALFLEDVEPGHPLTPVCQIDGLGRAY